MAARSRILSGTLLGVALAVIGVTGAAEAQYYPPPPGYYPPPGGYYRPAPDYPPPGYYRPRRDPYGFGPGYERRGNMSRICMTSRGPCGMERYQPRGSGCRCKIDGLRKGGVVD